MKRISPHHSSAEQIVKTSDGKEVDASDAASILVRVYGKGWQRLTFAKGRVNHLYDPQDIRVVKIGKYSYLTCDSEVYFCHNAEAYKIANDLVCVDANDPNKLFEFNPFSNDLVSLIRKDGKLVEDYRLTFLNFSESKFAKQNLNSSKPTIKFPFLEIPSRKRQEIGLVTTRHVETRLSNLNLSYKADDKNPHTKAIAALYQKQSFTPQPHHKLLDRIYQGTRMGIEYETQSARLEPKQVGQLGLIPLRDGSISGIEYATTVLDGLKGFAAIEHQCMYLSQYSTTSSNCSLHVHGSVKDPTRELIVTLYLLYFRIQEEIISMMPYYVKHPIASGKAKNYAESLNIYNMVGMITKASPKTAKQYEQLINELFRLVYSLYIGVAHSSQHNEFLLRQKKVNLAWEDRSWTSATRYCQLNLVNMIAKPSGAAEFRIHPASLHYSKVMPWTALCLTILKVAEKSSAEIISSFINRDKITLTDVIKAIQSDFKIGVPAIHSDDSPIGMFTQNLLTYVTDWTNHRAMQAVSAIEQATKTTSGTSGLTKIHLQLFRKEQLDEYNLPCTLFDGIVDDSHLLYVPKEEKKMSEKDINKLKEEQTVLRYRARSGTNTSRSGYSSRRSEELDRMIRHHLRTGNFVPVEDLDNLE